MPGRRSLQARIPEVLGRGDTLTVQQMAVRLGGSPAAVQKAAEQLYLAGVLSRPERGAYCLAGAK